MLGLILFLCVLCSPTLSMSAQPLHPGLMHGPTPREWRLEQARRQQETWREHRRQRHLKKRWHHRHRYERLPAQRDTR